MSEVPQPDRSGSVVLVIADAAYRSALEQACRAAGLSVLAAGRVAEVEQWPEGQVVVTDAAHLTRWWRLVGAADVIVLVRDDEEGVAALENGATRWLQPPPAAEVVAAMVLALTSADASGADEPRSV